MLNLRDDDFYVGDFFALYCQFGWFFLKKANNFVDIFDAAHVKLCLGGNYKMLGNARPARMVYTYDERYVVGECILSSAQCFPIQNLYKQQGQLSIFNFYSI